jgi:AraC family transcriptional regulator
MNSQQFEPLAQKWRSFAWSGGSFDTALRPRTRRVEGKISLHYPTIITIVDGGCNSLEVTSECGHRHRGPDFAGSVSFVPPACGRQLKMSDVR